MFSFKTPFRSFLCGPSMSGKTTLLTKIIENKNTIFTEEPKIIYYCYSTWQKSYDMIKTIDPDVKFIQGLDIFDGLKPNSWLIIDDLAESIEDWSREMIQLFTVRSHHENISVTLVLHNLFQQSKSIRNLALNTTYYIIYRVVRDSSSLITLNKQVFPGKPGFLLSAYNQATARPYGYIILDLNQNTRDDLRVISDIFDKEITAYLPLNSRNSHQSRK